MARAAFLLLATAAEGFHLQATEADPCACLEWKEVYSNYLAHCGDAYEYFAAEQKGVPHDAAVKYLEQPFCRDFFEKLDDNECVNLVHDNTQKMWFTGKTWCWVSKGCPKISEMAFDYKVHAKVKFCGPEDKALGHFWPSELETYSQDHDLDVGLLAKFAYPVEHGFSWSAFKDTVMHEFCATLKDGKESESMPAAVNESEASDVEEAAGIDVAMSEVQVNSDALMAAYGLLAGMLVVPQFVLIHHYLHLLIMAPLLVWIGCQRALLEARKAPGESQVETVSKRDAMRFPFVGSAVLFGLYIVIKLVNKEYLDILIAIYFSFLGAFGLFGTIQAPLTAALKAEDLPRWSRDFHWQLWKKREDAEPLSISCSALDVGLFVVCAAVACAYGVTKKWWLNNLLGAAFSIQGIEMLSLGSYLIGCLLLCGLFFYDIFWVFGTEVMVAVAKGLNAPVKILFPKALGVKPIPLSMLGLGDIVIPGIFVALMLRFDAKQGLAGTPYFLTNMVAYVVGLALTVGVMHVFDAAQPALLYLVPACLGSSMITAGMRGEFKTLLNFSEEKPAGEKAEKGD